MPKDAPVDVGAPPEPLVGPHRRVSEMQTKLHRWAAADRGRSFDDLFNFVCDPATLLVAFDRVAGNHGANTGGVDGLTAAHIEEVVGVHMWCSRWLRPTRGRCAVRSRASPDVLLWRGYDLEDEVEGGEQVDEFVDCEFVDVGLE